MQQIEKVSSANNKKPHNTVNTVGDWKEASPRSHRNITVTEELRVKQWEIIQQKLQFHDL